MMPYPFGGGFPEMAAAFWGAWMLDLALGDPAWMYHPVRFFGRVIEVQERWVRRLCSSPKSLRTAGYVVAYSNAAGVLAITFSLMWLFGRLPHGRIAQFVLTTWLLYRAQAGRCLEREARAVVHALGVSLEKARAQLSRIVGRDTKGLSASEVLRATVETVAENGSDGVVAPLFWAMLAGPAGAMAYKMINTMDSMIAYQNARYIDFGRAAAKLDDAANLLPARLSAAAYLIVGCASRSTWRASWREAKAHASPNAGYPESAMAHLLGVRLGGDARYQGKVEKKAVFCSQGSDPQPEDVFRASNTVFRSTALLLGLYTLVIAAVYAA